MSVRRRIAANAPYLVFVLALASASTFFTLEVQAFRAQNAAARLAGELVSGARARVIDVISGDEVVVAQGEGERFVVRLLGIRAFDPGANDPGVSAFGQAGASYLSSRLKDQVVTLELGPVQRDGRGRVLAYLSQGGEDVGRALVGRGLAIAHLQYESPRESDYLAEQSAARHDGRGLWGAPRARERADALLASWRAGRGR